MIKKLSVIVPQYNEPQTMIERLLNSIDLQVGIDFDDIEVIIVNDHNDAGYPQIDTQRYPFEIRLMQTDKNGGVGVTREYGIERARGELFTCIDADDTLFSATAISSALKAYADERYDYASFLFYEETADTDGKPVFFAHRHDMTWLHGKVIRKKVRDKLDIHFEPTLRVHEDGYYNALFTANGNTKCRYYDVPFYIWRNNPVSTVRNNQSAYKINSLCEWIRAQDLSIDEMRRRKYSGLAGAAFMVLAHLWARQQCRYWEEQRAIDALPQINERLAQFIKKHETLISRLTMRERADALTEQAKMIVEPLKDKIQPFDEWLTEVTKCLGLN